MSAFWNLCAFMVLLLSSCCSAVFLNIHIKLDHQGERRAIGYNQLYHQLVPHNDIFLNSTHQPHATLFLTDFGSDSNIPKVIDAISSIVDKLRSCPIKLTHSTLNGTYAFWMVENSDCLQYQSDLIANTTAPYVRQNQTIPSWVLGLPEPERSERIDYVQRYGSPNVFRFFNPHVTILGDNTDSAATLLAASQTLAAQVEPFVSVNGILGVGSVGDYGTVLRGRDYGDWKLKCSN